MNPTNEFLPVPVAQSHCNTMIKITKVTFEWTIHEFRSINMYVGDYIESERFTAKHNENIKWFLAIHPMGNDENNEEYISVFLHCETDYEKVVAGFKLQIMDSKQSIYCRISENKIFDYSSDLDFCRFIKRDDLLDETNGYLPGNTLRLYCEINVLSEPKTEEKQNAEVQVPHDYLSKKFTKLLDSKEFSDFKLKVKGQEIHVHKTVLAASSDVFAAMFKHEMAERNSDFVEINDIEYCVMLNLVRFIYTGKINSMEDEELLYAANKYDIEPLKNMCEVHLGNKLTFENAGHLLILSDMHNAMNLKETVTAFIRSHTSEVLNTIGWKSVVARNLQMAYDVLEQSFIK